MTDPDPPSGNARQTKASSRLVPHEIEIESYLEPDGSVSTVATVFCERKQCFQDVVGTCKSCERFARVETHEAGYTLLCRSADVPAGEGRARRARLPDGSFDEEEP